MSAITGIFYRDGRSVDPELMKKMNDRLSHRGHDGSQIWVEGSIGLGHQMLWTTPESLHEQLPFEENGLVITADARIDNRNELSEELGIEDKEEIADSYFILKAYEKWGEDCPDKLLGDFAFAIWDKNEEKLFCARDHWGVKPFYYYLDDKMFIFTSEIKSIFSIPHFPINLNELVIALYLGKASAADNKMTIYEKIFRLPSAHSLTIDFIDMILNEYWNLNPDYSIHLDSDEEYEKAFLKIFKEAVNCRLRSVYPIGSMLSGGLDSSSVACMAQKLLEKKNTNLKTFSAVFDSVPETNERHFIEKVTSTYEFDAHFIKADEISPLNEIDEMFWYRDQPLLVPNTFMSRNIYKKAGEEGVRVLLDGFDGDVIVSHGNGYLTELAINLKWKKLILELKELEKLGINPYGKILNIVSNLLPRFLKRKLFIWRENNQNPRSRTRILKKEFKNRLNIVKKVTAMYDYRIKIVDAHKMHYMSLKSGLLQWEMELLDSLSVPFYVERRHPFYDKRLVEFCLAIPTDQKLVNGWDRSIMRRAMSGILPTEIQWRKSKGNMSFNFKRNFMNETKILNNFIQEPEIIEEYIDIEEIQNIYDQCKNGDNKYTIHLWHSLIMFLWLKSLKTTKK